jgi:NAD(P)-dependent dehydrogenase (short-subunit alcohol dehydrogenase family)
MKAKPVVVITGATAGVGRAAAREFARTGARCIALIARDEERLEETRSEIQQLGVRAIAISADVANAEDVERAADEIERQAGPIDVWVNNAMTTIFAPLDEISPDEFRRVTEVCYLGTVHGTMSALRRMRPRNRGKIIQVGSALAYRAIPLQSAYTGAKHAVRGFTDAVRCELLHDNSRISISMVHLPGVNTPQFVWARTAVARHPQPVGPVFQPEVAARAIVWAASHARRELFVGAPSFGTVALNKLFPGLMDRVLSRRAYEQQFGREPIPADRPDNLFRPVATTFQAHGPFDDRAHRLSPALWISTHRSLFAVLAVGSLLLLGFRRNGRRRQA